MGGGNGTLAQDVLTYIRDHYPDVYDRTKYRIIEISENLARVQMGTLDEHLKQGTVEIVNKSVFEWEEPVLEPCFFLALEVIVRTAIESVYLSLCSCSYNRTTSHTTYCATHSKHCIHTKVS
jgi:hypothetical protein